MLLPSLDSVFFLCFVECYCVRSKVVVLLLLLIRCRMLLPSLDSVFLLCFVECYFVSILVLHSY